jgi:hypothetical protein
MHPTHGRWGVIGVWEGNDGNRWGYGVVVVVIVVVGTPLTAYFLAGVPSFYNAPLTLSGGFN